MTTDTAPAPSGRRAAGVHWDLSPLVSDAAEARARLDAALERSRAFESRYRGALPDMDGPALAEALEELAGIDNELSRVSSYAHLRESVDVTDEENKDLSAAVDRGLVEAGNALRFFDLEWLALDDDARARPVRRARGGARPPLPGGDAPLRAAHAARSPRSACSPSGARRPRARGTPCSARSPRRSRCPSTRARATASSPTPSTACSPTCATPTATCAGARSRRSTTVSSPHTDTLAHVYDTLVGDRLAMDTLRGYAGPMEPTHLRNELPGGVVEGMMDAVERHYGLAHRWFRVKAGHPRPRPAGAARPVRADRRGPRGGLPRGARGSSTSRSAASRRASPRSPAGSSRSAASTPSRGPASAAAPSARRSPRTPRRTSS